MSRENFENQNLNESELSDSFDESSCENHNEVDALNEEATILENEFLLYPETPKNKFLYPDVEYGKVENEEKESNQVSIISHSL